MTRRRTLLATLGTGGVLSFAGCSSSRGDNPGNDSDGNSSQGNNPGSDSDGRSSAASLVEEYYTAAANGNLERAASCLSMTQLEGSGDGASVEQLTDMMRNDRGMSQEGVNVSLGEFNELSVSEFATFTFSGENGEQRQLGEEEVAGLLPEAEAFGGDAEQITLVHHTGGLLPDIWVPYQPTEEPTDGWGEVIVYVGPFEGEPFIIGDFRSFTSTKATKN